MIVLLLLLLLAGSGPAAAQAPASAPVRNQPEDDHLPIQAYYYNAFFAEPWRLPNEHRHVTEQAVLVSAADVLVIMLLLGRRRRRVRKRA